VKTVVTLADDAFSGRLVPHACIQICSHFRFWSCLSGGSFRVSVFSLGDSLICFPHLKPDALTSYPEAEMFVDCAIGFCWTII
jgi:hypothetical protein